MIDQLDEAWNRRPEKMRWVISGKSCFAEFFLMLFFMTYLRYKKDGLPVREWISVPLKDRHANDLQALQLYILKCIGVASLASALPLLLFSPIKFFILKIYKKNILNDYLMLNPNNEKI